MQRLVAERPGLAGRAVVLYERHPRFGSRVKACASLALDQGVRPGLPLAEAQALLSPTGVQESQLHFELHDPPSDQAALGKLAEWCQQFSPLVGWEQADEPDCLWLDVGGVSHLFGGEESLSCQVVEAFQKRSLTVRVAIADTASAAGAVTRFAAGVQDHRHASLSPACFLVPPGDQAVVDRLPVAALRLPERIQLQLEHLGITRVGQLRSLPRASLAARFGEDLANRLAQLEGTVAEFIESHPPAPDWRVNWLLEPPTTHRETLEYVLRQLLTRLTAPLAQQRHGILQLEGQLICPQCPPLSLAVGLFQPTVDPQHLLALLQLQLDRLTLPDVVEEVRVLATATAPLERRQAELFNLPSRGETAKLAAFVERVSSRLGRERVVRPQLQAESQVELAYRCVPLTGGGEAASSPHRQPVRTGRTPQLLNTRRRPAASSPLLRPLRLLDPPAPIDVIGIALDGPPANFHYQGRSYRVTRVFGPERIETGWWRGPSSRRDYYRVETESGQRFWLFRRLQDQHWFLHGTFE